MWDGYFEIRDKSDIPNIFFGTPIQFKTRRNYWTRLVIAVFPSPLTPEFARVAGDERDYAPAAGEQGFLLADETRRLREHRGREHAGRDDPPGRRPERRAAPAQAAVLRVQLHAAVGRVHGQDIRRAGLRVLLRGAFRRARRAVRAEAGAAHPARVAAHQAEAAAHARQFPLRVQSARPVPHVGGHAADPARRVSHRGRAHAAVVARAAARRLRQADQRRGQGLVRGRRAGRRPGEPAAARVPGAPGGRGRHGVRRLHAGRGRGDRRRARRFRPRDTENIRARRQVRRHYVFAFLLPLSLSLSHYLGCSLTTTLSSSALETIIRYLQQNKNDFYFSPKLFGLCTYVD